MIKKFIGFSESRSFMCIGGVLSGLWGYLIKFIKKYLTKIIY